MKKCLLSAAVLLAAQVLYGQQGGKELATVPEGVNTIAVTMHGMSILSCGERTWNGQLGFDGNDVYVQGICAGFPESWIKGTMNESGTAVSFPSFQYLGSTTGEYGRDIWFAEHSMESEFTMAWNSNSQILSCGVSDGYMENTSLTTKSFLDVYSNVTITPQQVPLSITELTDVTDEVFTLTGQRANARNRGICIINGRKMLTK